MVDSKIINSKPFYSLPNKAWLVNFIFYSVSALLIATVLSYLIFVFRVYLQNQKINEIDQKMAIFGTSQDKIYEKEVFNYKQKIDDFTTILNNHKITSNILNFIEQKTLSNVWFYKFDIFGAANEVKLSGQTDNMEVLSRQVKVFEGSQNIVKSIDVLSSQVSSSGKIIFILGLTLDPKIFSYQQKAGSL